MFIKIVAEHLIMCIINFIKISSILVPDIIKFLYKSSVVEPVFWMIIAILNCSFEKLHDPVSNATAQMEVTEDDFTLLSVLKRQNLPTT